MAYRTEKDSLGTKKVPADAYYGIQTVRAIENFPISGRRHHPRLIDAFLYIKKAAALSNAEAGVLTRKTATAIVRACDEILSGKFRDQLVVDVYQMGAGTSIHMNVNEVLANRANVLLGGRRGTYKPVNPNDHVNFGQSTNDVVPTAMRLATLLVLREKCLPALRAAEQALAKKGRAFKNIVKSGRTHLQDAVPVTLGQEFSAYARSLEQGRVFLEAAGKSSLELGLGGSATGTGLNTAPGYRARVVRHLRRLTKLPLRTAADYHEAMQSQRPVAEVSAALRNLAVEVGRISNDFRLLASGPRTGFNEIILPPVAPGSSIMPGKVNPTIPEMMNMVCYQVIGCDLTISSAVGAGQLELNVMMPVMAHNILFMMEIFSNALNQLTNLCIKGIRANTKSCAHFLESSLGLATILNAYIGYAEAAGVAKQAAAEGKTIVQVIRERKLLSDAELKNMLRPAQLVRPGIPGRKST